MQQILRIVVFQAVIFLFAVSFAFAGSGITGKWKTIDDKTGNPKSIVKIYEQGGKYYGKIIKLFRKPGEDPDPVCNKCEKDDPRYKKRVIGMVILKDLTKDDDEYSGGNILDPEEGKIYRCKVWIEDGALKLRGYIALFFRTQTWHKVY
jgi:uncharacterized protein (DUF2147 family)